MSASGKSVCWPAPAAPLRWKRRKAQELFFFLLLQPRYSAAREQVEDALFGEEDAGKSSSSLHVAVYELNRTIAGAVGIAKAASIRGGLVRLDESWIDWVDVEQYGAIIRIADQLSVHPVWRLNGRTDRPSKYT